MFHNQCDFAYQLLTCLYTWLFIWFLFVCPVPICALVSLRAYLSTLSVSVNAGILTHLLFAYFGKLRLFSQGEAILVVGQRDKAAHLSTAARLITSPIEPLLSSLQVRKLSWCPLIGCTCSHLNYE